MGTSGRSRKNRAIIEHDRAEINYALRKYLSRLKGPSSLRRAMEYAVFSGGKRLRPILVIESCRTLNGDIKTALPFACAVEFIHNFSLIHDDLPSLDNDDFRRGKPTCHKRFGESLAVLAGDGLLNLAFGVLSRLKQKETLEVISLVSDATGVENMIGGQVLDLEYKNRIKEDSKLKSKIDNMKTASLIAVSCRIGSLVAKSKRRDVKRMYEFGKNLGCAFQIADDITDSAYNKATLNKMEGKMKFFISKGKEYIAPFREKADTLRYIADSLVERVENRVQNL